MPAGPAPGARPSGRPVAQELFTDRCGQEFHISSPFVSRLSQDAERRSRAIKPALVNAQHGPSKAPPQREWSGRAYDGPAARPGSVRLEKTGRRRRVGVKRPGRSGSTVEALDVDAAPRRQGPPAPAAAASACRSDRRCAARRHSEAGPGQDISASMLPPAARWLCSSSLMRMLVCWAGPGLP